ncbi:hypothetical protein OH76DRAFT_1489667 [Lentinus brumalis]|uniref:F-box domain-containing protein n=1 Tax=Lentinus brumalis TaxID=2498619 RepID=A0A371CLR9_9APHY|nr:hypothetical protein OH76DRAFT_1489667 [Polyporus brumalis]
MGLFATLDDIRTSTSFLLPERDLAAFVRLEADEVRKTSSAKIEAYTARIKTNQHHIADLCSIHNAALPLHVELPPELVLEIFRHVPFASRWNIRLLHVCRLWRSILQRTPEFWASFLSHSLERSYWRGYGWSMDEPMFLTSLNRSSPLAVQITGAERHLEILRTVPHHVVRLSSLTLAIGASSVDTLFSILRIKLPLLEKLVLKLTCKASNGLMGTEILDKIGPWAPPADNFPRLQSLDVNGVLFPTLAAPTLKHLRLIGCLKNLCTSPTSCSRTAVPSMDALLSGLQRCPALVTCKLVACLPARVTASRGLGVHLPELREFCIYANPSTTRVILETITFPPHTFLTTSRCITAQDPLLPTTPIPTVLALDTLSLKAWNSGTPYQRQIQRDGTYEGSSDERLTSLVLDFGVRIPVVEADWQLILDSFVRLASLTVRIDSCRTLLRVLQRGQPPRALETLSISCLKGRRVQELLVRAIEDAASKHLRVRRLEFRQAIYDLHCRERHEKKNRSNVPMSAEQLSRLKAVVAAVIIFPEVRSAD